MSFDSQALERLGHYVYTLSDPDLPGLPFYIGKGSGSRVLDHAKGVVPDEIDEHTCLSPRLDMIRGIKERGKEVVETIVRHGLEKEEALQLESALISIINTMNPDTLRNQISGHGSTDGMRSVHDLMLEYNAEPMETSRPLLIIKIGQLWPKLVEESKGRANDVPVEKIYRAVRSSWFIDTNRAKGAECVLAVARGLVRGVFYADGWKKEEGTDRKSFIGREADDLKDEFIGKSVRHLFRKGNSNPVKYHLC